MSLKFEQKVVSYPHNIHVTIPYMCTYLAMLVIMGAHRIHCWIRLLLSAQRILPSIFQYYKRLPSRRKFPGEYYVDMAYDQCI